MKWTSWLDLPGVSTIVDNLNVVTHATRARIFERQIARVLREDLDDFKALTIDSTSVKANSSWPTDARMLTGLRMRVDRLGQKMNRFGVENFRQGWVPRWREEMDKLEFQICLVAGKANSKGKLKKRYRQLLNRGRKAADGLYAEFNRFEQRLMIETLVPSRRVLLQRVIDRIRTDLADVERVLEYASDRVFKETMLPSTEKVLSLSDGSAAYIKKGSRNPVIGYKHQRVQGQEVDNAGGLGKRDVPGRTPLSLGGGVIDVHERSLNGLRRARQKDNGNGDHSTGASKPD